MNIVKPYTFIAGTKARANEVNEDFDRLYEQVNENISNISRNTLDIALLETNKANKAGDPQQKFAVADAYGASDNMNAINKRTLMKLTGNSIDVISGLMIRKDPSNPNDTIIVSAGSCYDSDREFVLSLYDELAKQNDNQMANGKYYVYIYGDASGDNTDILISTNSVNPFDQSSTNTYRQIGYFTTDDQSKIQYVVSYGADYSSPGGGIAASYTSGNNGYIVFGNGLKMQWGRLSVTTGRNQTKEVTFLIPFEYTNYNPQISWDGYQSDGNKRMNMGIYSRAVKKMTIKYQVEADGSDHNDVSYIYWMAIGY